MEYGPGIYDMPEQNEIVIIDGLNQVLAFPASAPGADDVVASWQENPGLKRKGRIPYSWAVSQPNFKRFSCAVLRLEMDPPRGYFGQMP